jgi:hypothetical protein
MKFVICITNNLFLCTNCHMKGDSFENNVDIKLKAIGNKYDHD